MASFCIQPEIKTHPFQMISTPGSLTMKTILRLLTLIAVFPLLLAAADREDLLKESVNAFWKATLEKDKVKAMAYVHPDDLNTFLNKPSMIIGKWNIAEIKQVPDANQAQVKIDYSMETYPGIFFNLSRTDTWQLVDNAWKLRVEDKSVLMKDIFSGKTKMSNSAPKEKVLRIRPDSIKFYKMNARQPAFIWIENYLDVPARLKSVEVDPALIRVAEQPELVNPGEKARIRLEYIGAEREKENLPAQVIMEIEAGDEVTRYTVPATYNYINEAMKWLQG